MNHGIGTVVYPVTDLAGAKAIFHELLGVEPQAADPYYVSFKVEGLDAGAQIQHEIKDMGGEGWLHL